MGLMRALEPESSVVDLGGRWRVIHDVRKSKRPHFVGLKIEFHVTLAQFGGSLVGSGEKFLVDSAPARPDEVSLLEISGRVEQQTVKLSLLERIDGRPERSLIGEILWRPFGRNHMLGSFEVDIAETSGRSEAFRSVSLSSV